MFHVAGGVAGAAESVVEDAAEADEASGSDPSATSTTGRSIGLAAGSYRTDAATAGNGRSAATICSTSRLLLCRAQARRSEWFSVVKCEASSPIAVSVRAPSVRRSRMMGKRRAARAAFTIRPCTRVLRKAQNPRAVLEERRTSLAEIQLPRIQFHERRDDVRGGVAFALRQPARLCNQLRIRQPVKCRVVVTNWHSLCIPSSFSRAQETCNEVRSRPWSVRPSPAKIGHFRRTWAPAGRPCGANQASFESESKKLSSIFDGWDPIFEE